MFGLNYKCLVQTKTLARMESDWEFSFSFKSCDKTPVDICYLKVFGITRKLLEIYHRNAIICFIF